MKIIPPIHIGEGELLSSNVPDNDFPEYSDTATYSRGDVVQVSSAKSVYECVISEGEVITGISPLTETDSPKWFRLGSMNKWAMFDSTVTLPTSHSSEVVWDGEVLRGIYVEISPETRVDSVAFFGLSSPRIRIRAEEAGVVVYDKVLDLYDYSSIISWHAYFFEEIENRNEAVIFGIPNFLGMTIKILIESPGVNVAEVKELVVGRSVELGCVLYGVSLGIQDFSRKTRDPFGNPILLKRNFSKRASFDLSIRTNEVDVVNKTLQRYRAQPVVYIVIDKYDSSIIYGFYRDFSIVLPSYSVARCQLELEGLNEG